MIEVKNVTKKYPNIKAVDNISFEIKDGEVVGFLGPNGAGKTTTMNMITGFIEPTDGQIIINGFDIVRKSKKAKKQIGYMPEGVPLYTELTAKEFVNYMAELRGVRSKERKQEVEKAIEETGLKDVQNKLIRNLSRGYKQRVSMAGALVGNPEVIILDEPTVGLDPKQITEIRNLIKELGKKHTVILSSHILSEVSQICERVIIINKGQIVAVDSPEHLEDTVNIENAINIIVEDKENKIEKIKIQGAKKIELIKKNDDNTKEYRIIPEKDYDIRKSIFSDLAKENITIFELKRPEITLEEAFMDLIKKNEKEKEEKAKQLEEEKKQKEEQKKQEKIEKKEQKQEKKNNKKANKKKGGKK